MSSGEELITNSFFEFSDIADYYNKNRHAINLFYSANNPNYEVFFVGKREQDVLFLKKEHLKQVEESSILCLLACCEAHLKYDLCIRRKRKDAISKELTSTFKNQKYRYIKFDELLKFWRKQISQSIVNVNKLLESVNYRNWLAHGKYWRFPYKTYDFADIFEICDSLFVIINSQLDTKKPIRKYPK